MTLVAARDEQGLGHQCWWKPRAWHLGERDKTHTSRVHRARKRRASHVDAMRETTSYNHSQSVWWERRDALARTQIKIGERGGVRERWAQSNESTVTLQPPDTSSWGSSSRAHARGNTLLFAQTWPLSVWSSAASPCLLSQGHSLWSSPAVGLCSFSLCFLIHFHHYCLYFTSIIHSWPILTSALYVLMYVCMYLEMVSTMLSGLVSNFWAQVIFPNKWDYRHTPPCSSWLLPFDSTVKIFATASLLLGPMDSFQHIFYLTSAQSKSVDHIHHSEMVSLTSKSPYPSNFSSASLAFPFPVPMWDSLLLSIPEMLSTLKFCVRTLPISLYACSLVVSSIPVASISLSSFLGSRAM